MLKRFSVHVYVGVGITRSVYSSFPPATCTAGTCDEYNSGANTCGAFGDKSSLGEGAPEPMPVGASQRAGVKAKKSKFGSFADLFR